MTSPLEIPVIAHTSNGVTNAGCRACGLGCPAIAPAASSERLSADHLQDGVDGGALLVVVGCLFGVPLGLLVLAVWGLQTLQLSAQPLLSFMLLAALGWACALMMRQRGQHFLALLQKRQNRLLGEVD